MKLTGKGHLKARRIDGKRRYRKHFIDAARAWACGDLSIDGDDLMVLTGPTMAGDGQCRVLRWKDAARCRETGFHRAPEVDVVLRGALPRLGRPCRGPRPVGGGRRLAGRL